MAEYISFQPKDNYKTQLYTGTGATNAQTFPDTTAMQPDFVWIKVRDAGARSHILTDSVRGVNSQVSSNDGGANTTYTNMLTSFDSDGFTLGDDATKGEVNNSGDTFVSYSWKMGTTSGLTGGSLTPSGYSFNATTGMGVYEYTGNTSASTITHGLGATPKFMLNKRLGGQEWKVYHVYNGGTKMMVLDQNDAVSTHANIWDNTDPTSTVFTIGSDISSAYDYIQYVFCDVPGFSKFGSYTGNGNADGAFVYTGFRPGWILIKRTNSTTNWVLHDNKRLGYNRR